MLHRDRCLWLVSLIPCSFFLLILFLIFFSELVYDEGKRSQKYLCSTQNKNLRIESLIVVKHKLKTDVSQFSFICRDFGYEVESRYTNNKVRQKGWLMIPSLL